MPPFAHSKVNNSTKLCSSVDELIYYEINKRDTLTCVPTESLIEKFDKRRFQYEDEFMETDDTKENTPQTINYSATVRFGRVPKNEKERIRQAMEKASLQPSQQEVTDEMLIQIITTSHSKSCDVTSGNIKELIRIVEQSPKIANIDPLTDCPLNPYVGTEDFHQKFSPIVREVVGFAKNIPGFTDVRHEDKITLLRACVFEVLLIRFSSLIDPQNKRMITISGYIINASIYANYKTTNDFVNTLFTFVSRINALNLSEHEMALFTAAIVINPKRQGLLDSSKINIIHKRIANCLHMVMQRERPNNPNLCHDLISTLNDLWILNGMHASQTQAKHTWSESDTSLDGSVNINSEISNKQIPAYSEYSDMQTCPIRYAQSHEFDEKRMPVDDSSPTSPTSTFSPDEEMRSPGSADSGCSTDSGCSIESNCSSDSGCSVTSHTNEHSIRPYGIQLVEDNRENLYNTEEEAVEGLRKCHIKRKPHLEEIRMENEKVRPLQWHKPQKESEKASDSPVLRMCLESPSTLKMDNFNGFYPGHSQAHPHKKFRPALDRATHETLDSTISSPRPSTTPSPSYSCSPSPSSSMSSSPLRVSSSPYSSNPSSPANSNSILASRLAMPTKRFPKTSSLLQSLTQDSKFGSTKALLSDTLHDCIMKDQSKIPRQHVLAAPSPSRYDDRISSPMYSSHSVNNMSPPHSITTSPLSSQHTSPLHSYSSSTIGCHIPPAHSPPAHTSSGLCGVTYAYSSECSEPLNLSTKTPPPVAAMES